MWLDGLLRMASDACRKLRSVLDFDCVGKCLEVVPATKKDLMHAQRFSPKTEDFQMQKYIPILNYSP